ncbi:GOLPH3/VPS74 family protein [Microtetraspora malaysiensis]|uniref:GOLPH3/VPS74 family protein n=1 Tax=Microtetraspora malaysiensis TaxID=161358 RepID=UPI0014716A57|nr:GPP34 family phosphoprotein [Microtetraspora malaysiensis]
MAEGDLSRPSLADDLFFVIHHNVTGRARLHPRLASLGLAGAVIGELMLAERVTLDLAPGQDRLYVITENATGDPLTQNALDHVVAEPHHPIVTWLHFFARSVYADVMARMITKTLLNPPARHLLKQQPATPVDANTAAWPLARLNLAIQRRKPPAIRDCVLYGLVVATGGAARALREHDAEFAAATTALLPVPLQRLIAQTEVVVGEAVISRR